MKGLNSYIGAFMLFLFLGISNAVFAQFQVNGNAVNESGNIYRLTNAVNDQFGAIWYKLQHDLNTTLNVEGQLYFGTDDGGADGICFVMQNTCLNAGAAGGGIGYAAMPGQSIAIEFDTYENSLNTGVFENHDPAYDHIAIQRNGSVDHASVDNLYGPIQMDPVKTNVEDGLWYDFRINYNPATTTLTVYFNGSLRFTYVYDIKNTIFGGDSYVYWGFTSATGGFNNEHRININANQSTFTIKDATICNSPLQVHLPPLSNFAQKNVALSKTAVSSSEEWAGTTASLAIDGDMGSRWSSEFSDPQWIYLDLHYEHDIDSVVLYWEGAYSSDYIIQRSSDGVTWTDLFHETNGDGGKDLIPLVMSNVRYVRMYSVTRATPWGSSLFEFQLWGKPKYVWSPNDGSINDVYSQDPVFDPASTTTYTVLIPDNCYGAVPYNMTITVDCPMPVEISKFVAVVKENVHLYWTTTLEFNSHYFEVLRSFDGIHFTAIGYVNAVGHSNSNTNYHFVDNEPYSGIAYYQLKEVDIDEVSQKSSIIAVVRGTDAKATVLQPVFEDQTELQLPSGIDYVRYKIVDVIGREVYAFTNNSPGSIEYIGKYLSPGVYVLIVETNISLASIKLNKVK